MPNEFNYLDPDDDDIDAYEPNPLWRLSALALLGLMILFSMAAIAALFMG